MTLYTVSCWSEGEEWIVYVHELDRSASARRVSQVSTVAHELVDAFGRTETSPAAFTYQLLEQPPAIDLESTRTTQRASAAAEVESATVRNGLAWRMAVQGVPFQSLGHGAAAPAGWIDTLSAQVASRGDDPASATPDASIPDATPGQLRHRARYYPGADDLVTATLAYVAEGLAGGEAVMLAVPADRLDTLTRALGDAARDVDSVITDDADDNPARLLPRLVSFVEHARAAGQNVRIVHEIPVEPRHPQLREEWLLHEELLDLALAGRGPVRVRCLLDLSRADIGALDEIAACHAVVQDGDGVHVRNGADAAGRVSDSFHTALRAPEVAVDEIGFDPESLATVRQFLIARALAAGVDEGRTSDVALAVWEIARDASAAADGECRLRAWTVPDAFVCEVSAPQQLHDPLIGRVAPASWTGAQEVGVWLANQLCDLVQVRATVDGAAYRVSTWL